jgi:hypothetical protein
MLPLHTAGVLAERGCLPEERALAVEDVVQPDERDAAGGEAEGERQEPRAIQGGHDELEAHGGEERASPEGHDGGRDPGGRPEPDPEGRAQRQRGRSQRPVQERNHPGRLGHTFPRSSDR